jgi:hypothetical protein
MAMGIRRRRRASLISWPSFRSARETGRGIVDSFGFLPIKCLITYYKYSTVNKQLSYVKYLLSECFGAPPARSIYKVEIHNFRSKKYQIWNRKSKACLWRERDGHGFPRLKMEVAGLNLPVSDYGLAYRGKCYGCVL